MKGPLCTCRMPGSRSENCFNRVVFLSFVRTKDAAARAARVRILKVKKIRYKRNVEDLSIINQKGKIQTYLWVGLVLHALNKHTFDDFHIVLLLVAKDSWEVPKTGQHGVSCLLSKYSQSSKPCTENRKTMILSAGAHQNICSAASRRPTLGEFTDSKRNLSSSGHWLFPSSS